MGENVRKKVAIDIGHGSDTYERTGGKGVEHNGVVYEEHTVNSKVAERLRTKLEDVGIEVIYGQEPNCAEVPLRERTDYYNEENVDLVYSIHMNGGQPEANGSCSFYWHSSEEAERIARLFAEEVSKAGYQTHGDGTHAAKVGSWTNMHICRETKMVALLTENGFMTNDEDFERIFKSDKYLEDCAEIGFRTILRYFGISIPKPKPEKGDRYEKADGSLARAWSKAHSLGLTDGSNPGGVLSRAQGAAMLVRAIEYLEGGGK